MNAWPNVKLADLCTYITVGHVGKMSDQYVENGIPFLRSQDVEPGRIEQSSLRRIPEAFHNKLRKSQLFTDDVVIVRTGYPGTAAVIPPELNNANCADLVIVRTGPGLIARYLAFLLNSPWGRSTVRGRLVGAAQQHFNVGVVQALEIPVPPLEHQSRIVSLLGDFDDLIEINRRRIAILEDMARSLFEEWFVRLRFPGKECVALVNGPDGALPDGWRLAKLSDVATVNARSINPSAAPDQIGYIDISSVSLGTVKAITWQPFNEAPGRARRRVRDGTIIWSNVRPNRRSYALLFSPPENLIVSTGFSTLDAVQVPSSYLFEWVTTDQFVGYLANNATGAAYPAVSASTFGKARILIPTRNLLDQFDAIAGTQLRLAATLRRANMLLADMRDLLLPRLISGELTLLRSEPQLEAAAVVPELAAAE